MFISVFNYLCLKECNPPESQWCWNESRLAKLLVFCLLSRKFGQSFFVGVSFVSFYKQAKSVSQQMRNCVCKTQTGTMVRGHHWSPASTALCPCLQTRKITSCGLSVRFHAGSQAFASQLRHTSDFLQSRNVGVDERLIKCK